MFFTSFRTASLQQNSVWCCRNQHMLINIYYRFFFFCMKLASKWRRTGLPSFFPQYRHSLKRWYNYSTCFKLNAMLRLLFVYSLVCYWFKLIHQSCGSTMDHEGTARLPYGVIFHFRDTSTASFCETNKKTPQPVGVGSYVSTTNTNKKETVVLICCLHFK
jgi:hypothetical protein